MKIGAAPSASQNRDTSSTFLHIPHITRQTRCPPTSASPPPSPMHPVASFVLENVYKHHTLLVPLVFTIFATVTNIHQPIQHALLITAVSWLIIWLVTAFKAGIWSGVSTKRRKISGLAGACLAFAHICDRVACDKRGTWTTKVRSDTIDWKIYAYYPQGSTTASRGPPHKRGPSQARLATYPRFSR